MEAVAVVRSLARLVHGGRALARACGTEAREEASRASREASEEAKAARLSLQKGTGDATGQPRDNNGEHALCMAATHGARVAP